jgi:hypothetical protein
MRFMTIQEALAFDFRLPPTIAISVMTLGPRQDRFTSVIFERLLTKAELRQFRTGARYFYIFGTVRYRDAFGKPRYTNYCYSIGWWNKRGVPIWHTMDRHNDSD